MTDAQDRGFAAYLQQAMDNVGLTAADLARATGVRDSVISRWLKGSVPTVPNLRQIAPVLRVPTRDLVVRAGHMLPEEVGLVAVPEPPHRPPDVEAEIRADAYLSDDKKEALIAVLRAMRAEYADGPPVRHRKEA